MWKYNVFYILFTSILYSLSHAAPFNICNKIQNKIQLFTLAVRFSKEAVSVTGLNHPVHSGLCGLFQFF